MVIIGHTGNVGHSEQISALLAVQSRFKTVGNYSLETKLKELVKLTSNDQELGAKIRKLL